MSLNQILIWSVCISCIALLARYRQLVTSSQKGWIGVCTGILIAIIFLVQVVPNIAGYLAGILWFALIFLPLIANRLVQNYVLSGNYLKAARVAAFWRWFHPTDGWWEQPEVFRGLALAQQGNLTSAINVINRYGDRHQRHHNLTWLATALAYKANLQWEELVQWIERVPKEVLMTSPNLAIYYIQALGETGNINRAIAQFKRLKPILDPQSSHYTAMLVLAFAGETQAIATIFRNLLTDKAKYFQLFWLGTAQIAAGNKSLGRELLAESARIVSAKAGSRQNVSDLNWHLRNWQRSIEARLQHGVTNSQKVISPASESIIQEIQAQVYQEFQYGGALKFNAKKAAITYGLIALNCLMFVWETVAGGNENEETLYRLGALVPTVVWGGEWWRLLSATFLHYGTLHLTMNMLGLYFLGGYVESNLGIGRYLVAYFFSGIGSMLTVTLVAIFTNAPTQLLVGASGAIMGMVGALAAILLRGWLVEKAPLAGQRLRSVMFIIGLQIVFDLNTPQVSFLGHLSGLILGFAIASLFVFCFPKTRV